MWSLLPVSVIRIEPHLCTYSWNITQYCSMYVCTYHTALYIHISKHRDCYGWSRTNPYFSLSVNFYWHQGWKQPKVGLSCKTSGTLTKVVFIDSPWYRITAFLRAHRQIRLLVAALSQKVGREERGNYVFSLKVFLSLWDGSSDWTAIYTCKTNRNIHVHHVSCHGWWDVATSS